MVLPHPRSGTTAWRGTTASLAGTTVSRCGTTAPLSSTTARHKTIALGSLHFVKTRIDGRFSNEAKERWRKGTDVYALIPPKPFRRGPPLNSTAFLQLKSTEKKRRETPSSLGSEGHRIVLCLDMRYLKCSMHTISPQMHCHQSPKPHREEYALTPSMTTTE
jgi:hypothetical protein